MPAKRALQYIFNTGQSATIEQFDDDHSPIGPALRQEIIPVYAEVELETKKLKLTAEGLKVFGR